VKTPSSEGGQKGYLTNAARTVSGAAFRTHLNPAEQYLAQNLGNLTHCRTVSGAASIAKALRSQQRIMVKEQWARTQAPMEHAKGTILINQMRLQAMKTMYGPASLFCVCSIRVGKERILPWDWREGEWGFGTDMHYCTLSSDRHRKCTDAVTVAQRATFPPTRKRALSPLLSLHPSSTTCPSNSTPGGGSQLSVLMNDMVLRLGFTCDFFHHVKPKWWTIEGYLAMTTRTLMTSARFKVVGHCCVRGPERTLMKVHCFKVFQILRNRRWTAPP